jgi:hypothetical protein
MRFVRSRPEPELLIPLPPFGRVTFDLPEQTQPAGDSGCMRPKFTVTGGLDSVDT